MAERDAGSSPTETGSWKRPLLHPTVVVIGILLSRETMEYAPWISLFCCNACCGCTVQYGLFLLVPPILSLSLTRLEVVLDGKLSSASVGTRTFHGVESPWLEDAASPACWVDAASLQVYFAYIFTENDRHSCRSGASCELAVWHVLRDTVILHVADMAKPARASLQQQSKHAWYSCLAETSC